MTGSSERSSPLGRRLAAGKPRVVTVIVHHRGEAMLRRCLETLLASRWEAHDVVVVANGCDEELPEIVGTHPSVHAVETPSPMGFSAANNFGVEWAREHLPPASYWYFLNNDTASTPEALPRLVAALESSEQAAVAGPKLLILDHPEYLNSLGINVTEDAWGWDEGIGISLAEYGELPPTRSVLAVTGSALLIDASVFRQVGGWTEIYDWYFEDVDLCLAVRERGYEVLNVVEAEVHHQISATMTTGSERKLFFFERNRLYLAALHFPALAAFRVYLRVLREILSAPLEFSALKRRALGAALRRLPALLRLRSRGERSWTEELRPAGSTPVITLPSGSTEERDESETGLPLLRSSVGESFADAPPPAAGKHRCLVIGWSPLPFEEARMHYAPGGRTWQLARGLADEGHRVCVICARMPGAYDTEEEGRADVFEHEGVRIVTLALADFERSANLRMLRDAAGPDLLVGASVVPARWAARVAGDLPLWADLFGDPMAEAQARDLASRGEAGAPEDPTTAYAETLVDVLLRGDRFSAVSDAQRLAVVGQLGLTGRLSGANAGDELVATMPIAVHPAGSDDGAEEETTERERKTADEDFVVLWSGSFNTWCDVDLLFAGLERAMSEVSEMRFVATGGAVLGHDEATYRRFRGKVAASPHRERFELLGHLPRSRAVAVWRRADVAVVTERRLYERELGSSARIVRWLADGVPLICTAQSAVGRAVESLELGYTYPPGDVDAFVAGLRAAYEDREELRRRAAAGRRWARRERSVANTTVALLRWASAPDRAGDLERGDSPYVLRLRLEIEALQDEVHAAWTAHDQVRSELGKIHHSRMWKTWMAWYGLRRAVGAPFRAVARVFGRGGG